MPTPEKVLITGGHEVGGVASFAEGLAQGFTALGIPSEVIPPSAILSRWRELCDPSVLKILSTSAVLAAPMARRAICIAHETTRAYLQGFWKMVAVMVSFKLANACFGTQLVAVSDYVAIHLQTIFNVRIDAVIRNPLRPLFLEAPAVRAQNRCYITYVGRLEAIKNLHRLMPAICDLLDETPGLRACIIGDGSQRARLESCANGDPRIEFKGTQGPESVREWLRLSKVFVSGTPTEGLGIAYLEALSQGCAVAMPACGGGLEISLEEIGKSVQLLPLSFDRAGVLAALRRAIRSDATPILTNEYGPQAVAESFLKADSRFTPDGNFSMSRLVGFEATV
jgi:glycosyltransferase involved in cell wall biosynthesis